MATKEKQKNDLHLALVLFILVQRYSVLFSVVQRRQTLFLVVRVCSITLSSPLFFLTTIYRLQKIDNGRTRTCAPEGI
jgi:hypothetical protein